MVNLKSLLTKMLQTMYVPITEGTLGFTTTVGSAVDAKYIKWGHVVQISFAPQKTSSTAAGSNIFEGTITDASLRPHSSGGIMHGCGYYGGRGLIMTIDPSGEIVVRNASGSSHPANVHGYVGATYFVA